MKTRILFTILLAFVCTNINAQTQDKLSQIYGIGIFKLNTSPTYYAGRLQTIDGWSKNPNVSGYTYIGNDFKTYSGIPIKRIVLSFFQNKLMTIQIDFDRPFSTNDYKVVLNNLNSLYGNGDDCGVCGATNTGEFTSVTGFNWNDYDSPVRMTFFRGYSSYDGWCGVINIYEGKLWKQRVKTD